MFGFRKKNKKQNNTTVKAAHGTAYDVHTMASDLVGNSIAPALSDSAGASTPSPFLLGNKNIPDKKSVLHKEGSLSSSSVQGIDSDIEISDNANISTNPDGAVGAPESIVNSPTPINDKFINERKSQAPEVKSAKAVTPNATSPHVRKNLKENAWTAPIHKGHGRQILRFLALFALIMLTAVFFYFLTSIIQNMFMSGVSNEKNDTQELIVVQNDTQDMARGINANKNDADKKNAKASNVTMLTIMEKTTLPDVRKEILTIISALDSRDTAIIRMQDTAGDDMLFNAFARKFLPLFPETLTKDLAQPFLVYIVPDDGEFRVVIYVTTTDSSATRTELRAFEPQLPGAMQPFYLFTAPAPDPEDVVFEDNVHQGIPVRFYNISFEYTTQAIDYIVHYEHVLIGTSRASLRSAMDTIFEK